MRRLLFVPFAILSLLVAIQSAAAKPVTISERNAASFSPLIQSGKNRLCRKLGGDAVDIGTKKRINSKPVFYSDSQLIKDVKKNSDLSATRKAKKLLTLKARRDADLVLCRSLFGIVQVTPISGRNSTPAPTPTTPANPSSSPPPTPTSSGSATATPTATPSNGHGGHPFLHVVINGAPYLVDYNGNGSEPYALSGSGSHTHEPGHAITGWQWSEGATILGTTPNIAPVLNVGAHTIALRIEDVNTTPPTLSNSVNLAVYPISAVGGVIAEYYGANELPLATLIDALPTGANFMEFLPQYLVPVTGANVGGSAFTGNVVVRLRGTVNFASAGSYQFLPVGGTNSRILVDGTLVTGARSLTAGNHSVEARFGVATTAVLPATLQISLNGGVQSEIAAQSIFHSETTLAPFINSMPGSGAGAGGESVTITGVGFFPTNSVVVHWGATNLTGAALTSVAPGSITLTTPPGSGQVSVTVQTPNGTSNAKTFAYIAGNIPISFDAGTSAGSVAAPTQAAWGPDGRLYVGSFSGTITAYTFGDTYNITNTQVIPGVSMLQNSSILGIGFNPFDPPSSVKIYVAHSELFGHNGGQCFSGAADYLGQVSVLQGPNFTTVTPLVTRLPNSNHDHGINGLQFDNYGDLLIAVGGTTNGGIWNCGANCCNIGNLPESPLSAAVVKANTSKPGFNGALSYVVTGTGTTNNDQVFGNTVDLAPGSDVSVLIPGLRNTFDIVWSARHVLFGTDNGPNAGFGPFSTSATTQITEDDDSDKVFLFTEGNYYGHPNRNRGRTDNRQNIYRDATASPVFGKYSPPFALLPPSSDGMDEYRSTTFNSAMRGDLLVQRFQFLPGIGDLNRIRVSADGRVQNGMSVLKGGVSGLDVVASPGGAIIVTDYNNNNLKIFKPVDSGAAPMQAYDITPWRARSVGGQPFVIGGVGFSGTTSVTIGGITAAITSVTSTRIKGTIPANPNPTAAMLPVVVQSAGRSYTLTNGFRYLLNPGSGSGVWNSGTSLPTSVGEVAAGAVGGIIYLVGEGANNTFGYNHFDGTWVSNRAVRPFIGHHHGAEVYNQRLYLIGGIGGGSERKLQIYNPDTNSWTSSDIPTAVDWGSPATAIIGNSLYIAGGVNGNATHNQAMRLDLTSNVWSSIAAMPVGRNHAASATDGSRFFIFGGRSGGNVVTAGFNDVQIYNPGTNTWERSGVGGSTTPPLPQARGGMGKAVYFNREFYVIGGETDTPNFATYNRVDVYNPATQTWRLDAPMPTARHGIFPLAFDGRIFVAAGGPQAQGSASNILQIFNR